MAKVVLTGPAKHDIRAAYEWWRDNRSREQAERWYRGILAAARSLSRHPERCGPATESDLLPQGIRQLLFGLGRQVTHRLVFTIDEGTVIILRVRHTAQDALTPDDLQ